MFSRVWFPVLCLSVLCAAPFHLRAFEIIKLVPVTTTNSVRIELGFRCGPAETKISIDGSISDAKGKILWSGNLTSTKDLGEIGAGTFTVTNLIGTLQPGLWSPATPTLYNLKVTASREGSVLTNHVVHIGFRSFESRNGQIILNGRPIFLRGLAINPPGRTVPDAVGESRAFAEAYVRFMKNQNVNIIRVTHDSQTWFDVCDELGMMVYQGQYGSPLGSESGKSRPPTKPEKSIEAYHSLFETYARHPSIVVYILSNELPVSGVRGKAYHDFLTRVHTALRQWDGTRLYIGNAGYGEGREGDLCDVHRYWGWYYNTFLTYYNLRDNRLFGDPAKDQPITFSECVGNFTGPLGEYNQIVRKQLGAQLNWTGHSPDQRDDALRYQAFMVQQAAEIFRRLRPINPRLSGLMPFTTLFYNWSGIQSFDQMQAKPAMNSLRVAYQPILLSWELWTPQVYAGTTLRPTAHVINDSDLGLSLTKARLIVSIESTNHNSALTTNIVLPDVAYYRTTSTRLALPIPTNLPTGRYLLKGTILSAGVPVSSNQFELFIAGSNWEPNETISEKIFVFDEGGKTAPALRKLHLPITELTSRRIWPLDIRALVIGEFALAAFPTIHTNFPAILSRGGRILCLRQTSNSLSWLPEQITSFSASANDPTYPPATRPFRDNMHVNLERPDHPVFRGLERRHFELWSDYSAWDQTKLGYPFVFPVTSGFALRKPEFLARTAILADYDRGLEGIALCEMFSGKGSVLLSSFDLVQRVGLDPVADRFLFNLVQYTASPDGHEQPPFVKDPIRWGDYASERGVVTGPANGLLVNADWVKPATNPSATPLTQQEGAWNTRPGDQFVPHGRRPFGPYGYSTGSSLKDLNSAAATGTGMVWLRIPQGKTRMNTLVDNRDKSPVSLKISVNQIEKDFKVPPGKTTTLTLPIQAADTDLAVRFQGNKNLVILETAFE